jgi:hypothetical protein
MNATTADLRADPLSRLDAWVLEELEAVTARRPREPAQRRPAAEPAPREADLPPQGAPFEQEEARFIERAVAWLGGRSNADLILEEIWRSIVPAEAQADDEVAFDETYAAPEISPSEVDLDDADLGELDAGEAHLAPVPPGSEPPAAPPPAA